MNARYASALALLVLVVSSPLRAETAGQWIAKARAYLGDESGLNAVTTIRYTGTLEIVGQTPSAEEEIQPADRMERLPVEIVFQKPCQHRMTVTRPASVDIMVLDDYEGWAKNTLRQNPKQWRLTLLDADQIKQLRANTWENLSFFAGLDQKGGRVQLEDEAVVVDGIVCVKLSFIHSDLIFFHRYFDKSTGRLVKTETANGSEIREEGEITVNGLRFPRKVTNRTVTGQVTTIVFDTIVLNERVPAAEFAVPSLNSE